MKIELSNKTFHQTGDDSILLNPGPSNTTEGVKIAMLHDECPREESFGKVVEKVCRDILRVYPGGEEHYECIPFAASGTGGVEAMLSSIPGGTDIFVVKRGSYGERMCQIIDHINDLGYYEFDEFGANGRMSELEYLDKFVKFTQSCDKISHLALVHHETSTGFIEKFNDICMYKAITGAKVYVDMISSYGGVSDIDLNNKFAPDMIAVSSNKCLGGMPGLVFVLIKKEMFKEQYQIVSRSLYFDIVKQHEHMCANTGQMMFTPPVQVFYAMKRALEEYHACVTHKWDIYASNMNLLVAELGNLGFEKVSGEHILVRLKMPDSVECSFVEMHDFLRTKGVTVYPSKVDDGTFRISVIGSLTVSHMGRVVDAFTAYYAYVNSKKG